MKRISNLNEIENLETILKNAEIISYGPLGIMELENMHLEGEGTEGIFTFSLTKDRKEVIQNSSGYKEFAFILEIDLKKSEIRESTKVLKSDSLSNRGNDICLTIREFSYEDIDYYLRIEAKFNYGALYGYFNRAIEIKKSIEN